MSPSKLSALFTSLAIVLTVSTPLWSQEDVIWIEGESASSPAVTKHSWYSAVKSNQLSGNDLLSHFNDDKVGRASYSFTAPQAGEYELWVRTNPIQSALSYSLNATPKSKIDLTKSKRDEINIAADDKPDLRFLAWIKVDKITLKEGTNKLTFFFESAKHHHGYLDCFLLSPKPILPRGATLPNATANSKTSGDWVAFEPGTDAFDLNSAIDLRHLNERFAGEHGRIVAKDGQFFHSSTGAAVRFWGVNGPPEDLHGDDLARCARLLAKYGVNLVRIHGAVFDQRGEVDRGKIEHIQEVVQALKKEGIYSHLSIYFPLWLRPAANLAWLPGYDGSKHPFAALFFNEDFQAKHRKWISDLLTTPDKTTGKSLLEEPALFGIEIQNEDSLFFWTFSDANLPEPQLKMLEQRFGAWLVDKYGTLEKARQTWRTEPLPRDDFAQGQVAFRPLWNIANERTERDQDTAAFLLDVQTKFYQETTDFVRKLGFHGLVHASNWTTASPERLTPLEKLSYLTGDFVDRHGYFGCFHRGENSAWSIRAGHEFGHRSALRFDPMELGKPKLFVHPVMDPQYGDKPSMISETTFTRPNRYRSEAPLYYAVYGALQDSDAVVHFAFDGSQWEVKPRFWTQPWTLATPAMLGQFPASALIYRQSLITTGEVMASVNLNLQDLRELKGTPLPQDAAFDELRLKDVPQGTTVLSGQRIDPLIHFTGRTEVRFSDQTTSVSMKELSGLISHEQQRVKSSTGEVELNYATGLLLLRGAKAQGASGALASQPQLDLGIVQINSSLELGHIVAVSLDDRPLETSERILLQVMSDEQATNFASSSIGNGRYRIDELGTDPWQYRQIAGQIRFQRPDARELSVKPLDHQGKPAASIGSAENFKLLPNHLYYLISK
jgi:hypothetical protein